MNISFHFNDILAVLCVIAGVAILVRPKLFYTIVAVLLIVYGLTKVVRIY